MVVLANVPLQLRILSPGLNRSKLFTKLKVLTLDGNGLQFFPHRSLCVTAEVSTNHHVDSLKVADEVKVGEGLRSSLKDGESKRISKRKRVIQDQPHASVDETSSLNKAGSVENAKSRKRAVGGDDKSELIEDGRRGLETSKKRVTGKTCSGLESSSQCQTGEKEGSLKKPVSRRRKSLVSAGDSDGESSRSDTSQRLVNPQIIPVKGASGDETAEESVPGAESVLLKPRKRRSHKLGEVESNISSSVRPRKKKEPETPEQELQISQTENISLKQTPDIKDSNFDEDFAEKKLDNSQASTSEEVITLTEEVSFKDVKEVSGESIVVEAAESSDSSARPLYMQVEKRRLEEQERRASTSSKKKKYSPVSELRFTLDYCSKFGDVNGALAAYQAHKQVIPFDLYNYNVLLYLCSSAALGVLVPFKRSKQRPDYGENEFGLAEEEEVEDDGVLLRGNMAGLAGKNEMGFTKEMMERFLKQGLLIYEEMEKESVAPDDATFTSLARLAVAKLDGDLAFDIVKTMVAAGLAPKLRCYGPALYIYFKQNDANKALQVYNHMLMHGVEPDEAELEVLLQLTAKTGMSNEVYSLLHQLRRTVRDVSQSTVNVIERWFSSGFASRASSQFAAGAFEVMQASLAKGGGWHGLGWLGLGRWKTDYTQLSATGACCNCGEQMVTLDVDPQKTDSFAESIASLASKKEHSYSFGAFKDWLDRNEPYETVVDGANVGFHNQRGEEINFAQLNSVVSEIYRASGRWPLVILHIKRTTTGPGKSAFAQQLLRKLSIANALYTTPTGSNDDWYWLYAAVKCKSLLVSNDEMRDHIFQLLGRDYFPTWKERHQVRFHVSDRGPKFYMPPPYSIIIQESVRGSWHAPVCGGDDISTPRKWLCVTRSSKSPDES